MIITSCYKVKENCTELFVRAISSYIAENENSTFFENLNLIVTNKFMNSVLEIYLLCIHIYVYICINFT